MRKIVGSVLLTLVFLLFICSVAFSEQPVSVSVAIDVDSVSIYESIHADYTITGGNGSYTYISACWQYYSGSTIDTPYQYPKSSSGTLSYTVPSTAEKVRLYVYAKDSDGRTGYVFSDWITVVNTESYIQPVQVDVSLGVSSIAKNETIQAEYAITGGNGSFTYISACWQYYSGSTIDTPYQYPKSSSGTLSYTVPSAAERIRLYVYAKDSDGRTGYVFSDWVNVTEAGSISTTAPTVTPIVTNTPVPTTAPIPVPTEEPAPERPIDDENEDTLRMAYLLTTKK